MPLGQPDQLRHQLLVPALEVQLVEDFADAADGPELLDEGVGVVGAFVDEVGGEVELLRPPPTEPLTTTLAAPAFL